MKIELKLLPLLKTFITLQLPAMKWKRRWDHANMYCTMRFLTFSENLVTDKIVNSL